MLFSYHVFIAPFSTSSFCIYCCFFVRYLVIIQRPFILHGIIWSPLHFKCQINLLTLDHEQEYMAYLICSFCFEAALFICCKRVWNFPRRIFFVNFSYSASCYLFDCTISCCAGHAWLLKQSQGILMSPFIQDETATFFIILSYQYIMYQD